MIPGLENAEFERYVNAATHLLPKLLRPTLQYVHRDNLFRGPDHGRGRLTGQHRHRFIGGTNAGIG
jgi:folate-dependent tRNA-U54 methylase TrmFO/GidA